MRSGSLGSWATGSLGVPAQASVTSSSAVRWTGTRAGVMSSGCGYVKTPVASPPMSLEVVAHRPSMSRTRHLTACPLSGVRARPSINQADYHRGCFASYARPSRPKNDQDPEPGIEQVFPVIVHRPRGANAAVATKKCTTGARRSRRRQSPKVQWAK
jgi:hypothetical protein